MRLWAAAGIAVAAALLTASRLHYAPQYLFYFDNVNFALAIEHFDPSAHQPQPPGYPLFVAFLKLVHFFVRDARSDLAVSGLIGSAGGIALVWVWAARMSGRRAGWVAAGLLAANPVFWIAGIVNPVRTFLVVVAAAHAILCWNCLTEEDPRRWFLGGAAALGFLSGFRPESLVLLFPLWVAVGVYRRVRIQSWLTGLAILAASALLWIAPLTIRIGGIETTYRLFSEYFRSQSQGHTLAFNSGVWSGLANARQVLVWNLGLAPAWIWALPLTWRSLRDSWSRPHTVLLVGCFVPPFLFHALVHVRNIDQTLLSIPVVCVLGGIVLSGLQSRAVLIAASSFAILVNLANFRRPMFVDLEAASGSAIRYVNDWTKSTFAALNRVKSDRSAVWIWDNSVVTWRQVSYYYPDSLLLDLQSDVPLWLHSNHGTVAEGQGEVVLVPKAQRLVLGVSNEQASALARVQGAERLGPLILLPWGPGAVVRVGQHILQYPPVP